MATELDGAVKNSSEIVEEVMSHTDTLVDNAKQFKLQIVKVKMEE